MKPSWAAAFFFIIVVFNSKIASAVLAVAVEVKVDEIAAAQALAPAPVRVMDTGSAFANHGASVAVIIIGLCSGSYGLSFVFVGHLFVFVRKEQDVWRGVALAKPSL
ncbi:hypothetical protein Ancab_006623 [Ancistrocladus abbreviatus]